MLYSKDIFIEKQRAIQKDPSLASSYERWQIERYGSIVRGGRVVKLSDIDKFDLFGDPLEPIMPSDYKPLTPYVPSVEWVVKKKAREARDIAAIDAYMNEGEPGYWRVLAEPLENYYTEITDEDLQQVNNHD